MCVCLVDVHLGWISRPFDDVWTGRGGVGVGHDHVCYLLLHVVVAAVTVYVAVVAAVLVFVVVVMHECVYSQSPPTRLHMCQTAQATLHSVPS